MQNSAHPALRKLKVDLDELETAFDNNLFELHYYLDLHSGKVSLITDEIQKVLEDIYEELYDDGDETFRHFAEAAKKRGLPDRERELLSEAHQVEQNLGARYVQVPVADTHEAYDDMQDFIETVEDGVLQEKLWQAIRGRGAFRYFKDMLAEYPIERERWFKFQDAQVRQRMLSWLTAQGIEPIR